MKSKLHFGLLVLLLAFLGTYLEHATVPNQQILIQFSKADVSSLETKNTIDAIKSKLQRSGATHIYIGSNQKGELRITYYSNADVAHIEAILSLDEDFSVAYQQDRKSSKKSSTNDSANLYELNISEIQQESAPNWDFDGIRIAEHNQKVDRSSFSKVNTFAHGVQSNYNANSIRVKHKAAIVITDAIDAISYKIPEVRAGPSSFKII